MVRVGAMDHPVARSSHTRPTPKGGGVGIVAAFAVGMALAPRHLPGDEILTVSTIALAIISYIDDVRNSPFWLKLAAQAVASLAIVTTGIFTPGIALPWFGAIPLGPAAPVLAFGWLMFVTNAVNFMDGLNGLAAGSAAIGCLTLACAAAWPQAWPACLIVAGVIGFLPFNYPRARIFMGDVGSQPLGFVIAALALRHASTPRISLILPLSLLPMLLDVGFTLARRLSAGERLTHAHRGHLYQAAQRSGLPAPLVTAIYWGMAALLAAGGAAFAYSSTAAALTLGLAAVSVLAWGAFVTHRARGLLFARP